jgi:hypothetical protein
MKKKLATLLAALLTLSVVVTPSANAIGLSISIGDRPYYEGPEFWDFGWRYVWVPGHWRDHHWVHGYYMRQGEWNHRYLHERHDWEHHHHHHDRDRD